jgi:hypothetical protein
MLGDVEVQNASTIMSDDKETIEYTERNRRHREEVHRGDSFPVISKKGSDTVEVCGSGPHGPTIFFSELASTTFLGQAPIGSIKEVARDSQGSSRLWAQTVEKDAPAS